MCQPQPAAESDEVWRTDNKEHAAILEKILKQKTEKANIFRPDVLDFMEKRIDGLSEELRALSIDIHGKLE